MYGTKHTYWEHEWPRKHGIVKENRPSVINMEKAQISELPSNVLKTIMVQQSVEQDDHLPRLGIQGDNNILYSISSFSDDITRVSSIQTQFSSTPL